MEKLIEGILNINSSPVGRYAKPVLLPLKLTWEGITADTFAGYIRTHIWVINLVSETVLSDTVQFMLHCSF